MVPIFLGIFIFFLIFPKPAEASFSVFINEFMAQPEEGKEWVELFNPGTETALLKDWQLKDKTSTPLVVFGEETISPNQYLVVEFTNKLNNDGDDITLIKEDGITVDSYTYAASTKGHSWGRSPDGTSNWLDLTSTTPGSSNHTLITNEPAVTTAGLSLSEFMAHPDGKDAQEWVEIYNDNLTTVNIAGFKIDDIEGGSSPFTIPSEVTIPARSFLYFYFDAKLNNDGDTVRFLSPSGQVIESFAYSSSTSGSAWAKDSKNNWVETTTPTLGGPNQITLKNASPTTSPTSQENVLALKSSPPKTTPKKETSTLEKPQVPSDTRTASVSAATGPSQIKLNFNQTEEEKPLVKGASTSDWISKVLIGLGIVIILSPIAIFFWRKRG